MLKKLIAETAMDYISEETNSEYQKRRAREQSHGPLMKANDWIKPNTISKLADHPEINEKGSEHTLMVGHLQHPWEDKKQHIAILDHGKPDPNHVTSGFKHGKKGYNVHHQWYEDTGNGHRFPNSTLVITGHIHQKADGSREESGKVDHDVKRTLMVYK